MSSASNPLSLTTMVLAGGRSSRMGQDKALLQVEGITLLERVCRVAKVCSTQVLVVSSWPDRYHHLPLLQECRFVEEVVSGELSGPLVGFAQGLQYVSSDWVLLLACDLPQLKGDVLQAWIQLLPDLSEVTIALLPRGEKGWEPLCGFYRRACLPGLMAFIERGGRSFQTWLAQLDVQELPISDPQMLLNCNTPEDLQNIVL